MSRGVARNFLQILPYQAPLLLVCLSMSGVVLCREALYLFERDGSPTTVVTLQQADPLSLQDRHQMISQ